MDEVHFQQFGSRCRMWVPPDVKDPVLLHHPGREKVGYFGAVRLRDGRFVYRQERKSFNAMSCWEFLLALKTTSVRTGRRVVVIADNARYHHALLHQRWRQDRAGRFELLFLPPYSPQLNPIERVWKLVRRLRLHNTYFAELNQVILSVEDLFTDWRRGKDTLRRLCAFT